MSREEEIEAFDSGYIACMTDLKNYAPIFPQHTIDKSSLYYENFKSGYNICNAINGPLYKDGVKIYHGCFDLPKGTKSLLPDLE